VVLAVQLAQQVSVGLVHGSASEPELVTVIERVSALAFVALTPVALAFVALTPVALVPVALAPAALVPVALVPVALAFVALALVALEPVRTPVDLSE
jgi:hypothetical protein